MQRLVHVLGQRSAPMLFVIVVGLYGISALLKDAMPQEAFHHHFAQAEAFLHGNLHIESYPPKAELAFANEKAHVVLPPGPSVVLMPFVVLGVGPSQVIALHILFSAASVVLLFQVLRQRGAPNGTAVVVSVAFAFGTVLWWCTKQKGAWHTAHVMSVLGLCFSLRIAHCRGGAFAAGMLVGFSAICRQLTVFALPYILYRLVTGRPENPAGKRLTLAVRCILGCAIPIGFYLLLNQARFGNPFETGYRFIELGPPGRDKFLAYGLFSLTYLPENLFTVLFAPPQWGTTFPYFFPHFYGQAILFTSPFLLYAFRVGPSKSESFWLWTSVLAMLLPQLCYFNNGLAQFGYRFALDFLPLWMLPIADRLSQPPRIGVWVLIVMAVAMNVLGISTL